MTVMLLALAGCTDTDPADTDGTVTDPGTQPEPTDPSPWEFTPDDPPPGDIDLAAMGRALDAAILEILSYDARVTIDPYIDAGTIGRTSAIVVAPLHARVAPRARTLPRRSS